MKNKSTSRKVKAFLFLLLIFSAIFLISRITAAGCCFNPTNGLCTSGSTIDTCSSPAQLFPSPNCLGVSSCQEGCCILGANTLFITERDCELRSRTGGFTLNFQIGVDESSCLRISRASETGACLFGDYPPFDCRITTRAECSSARFYPNQTCTSSELQTNCNPTSSTMCYNENVYTKDSCGNPENLASGCSYSDGNICSQVNSSYAFCKSLNCNNGKKNGESWCVNEDPNKVGSLSFAQSCINGKIETEPCEDKRAQYCENGKCKRNPWGECLAAGNDSQACSDIRECYMFNASKTLLLGSLNINKCLPKIQGGIQFYSSGAKTKDNTCSYGDFHAEVVFRHDRMSRLGNDIEKWGLEIEDPLGNEEMNNKLLIYEALTTGDASKWFDWEQIFTCVPENNYCTLADQGAKTMPANPVVIKLLKKRCSEISDCGPKLNYLGASGANIGTPITGKAITGKAITGKATCTKVDRTINDYRCDCTGMSFDGINACNRACQYAEANGACPSKEEKQAIETVNKELDNIPVLDSDPKLVLSKNEGWRRTYTLDFKCSSFKAPSGGSDCDKCGKDGFQCTEYRCKSLGQKCEYREPEGIDKGFCYTSDDVTPPAINLKSMNPLSPIKPFKPVEIKITTNEPSQCKFNVNHAGAKYEDMDYDFDLNFSTEHSVILTLPGQVPSLGSQGANYPLITSDGRYTLYVRCLDSAGNGEAMTAYPIEFEVMKAPDTILIPPLSFSPPSESLVKFNTTQKFISFINDEPKECRWSLEDKSFDQMVNNFNCDSLASNSVGGYNCSGTLRNITLSIGEKTTYYIRCKDQPWIENGSIIINEVNYSRNTDELSYEYKLGPSEKLDILEVSPSGSILIGGTNATIQLRAITAGGSLNGQATCYWRIKNESNLSGTAFTIFQNTLSNIHSQLVNNPYLILGDNSFEVKCIDSVGNEERQTGNFQLNIDSQTPLLTRILSRLNDLKINTDEEAVCYYSLDKLLGCAFNINNASLMSGVEKTHSAPWIYDKTYYIKCKDYFNNLNDYGCTGVIRTY